MQMTTKMNSTLYPHKFGPRMLNTEFTSTFAKVGPKPIWTPKPCYFTHKIPTNQMFVAFHIFLPYSIIIEL